MASRVQKSPASKRFRGHCRAVRLPNPERRRAHTDIRQRGAVIRSVWLLVLTWLISNRMVQLASPRMALSLVPVISGRDGGAMGAAPLRSW